MNDTFHSRPRIALADDQRLIVESLSTVLRPRFDVVANAVDGIDLLEKIQQYSPDAVITDISIPRLSGLDLAKHILSVTPQIKLVFVTVHLEAAYIRKALQLGVLGYISKRASTTQLMEGVESALAGRTYIDPLSQKSLENSANDRAPLTERQCQVLALIARGFTARQVANELSVSVRTAEFHRAAIMDKLKLRSTAQLTRYAVECGIA